MEKTNPFTPGPGLSPPHLAGRDLEQGQLGRALLAIQHDRNVPPIIMYGPRGTGKTVLLNWFRRECENQDKDESRNRGIHVVKTTPSSGAGSAESLIGRLLPRDWLPQKIAIGMKKFVGMNVEWTRPDNNAHGTLEDHLIKACQKKPRVLLLDEAHTLEADLCRSLLNVSQTVSEQAPFLLVLAGTPGLRPFLGTVGATFAERSQVLPVGLLDEQGAKDVIRIPLERDGISIEDSLLAEVVRDAQCYPWFLQLWGAELWNTANKCEVTELTATQVDEAGQGVAAIRQGFCRDRYDVLRRDIPLLGAAHAVACEFAGKDRLLSGEIPLIIEKSLPANLSGNARQNEAERLSEELNRIDFVWEPTPARQVKPGIPSFMAYVKSEVEFDWQLRSRENQSDKKHD